MSHYRVSAAAKADLDEIWFYIAQDDPDAADRFIRALVARFPRLASMPEMGRRREELAPQVRSLAFGSYVIFYRLMENGVEIARVLHGARDLPPLFE
jgi:toxin ParE1/3/4